jgi:excisionase family DNA binding protein
MAETDEGMPEGAVTVVNARAWGSRARELAGLLIAAGNRPEGSRFVRDPDGSLSGQAEIAQVADPAYWSSNVPALAEALAPRSGGEGARSSVAAGAAPAGVERLTLTVEEAAVMLGVSRAGAYEAVQRGEIPSIRIGRRILVPKAALQKLLETT